MVFIGTHVTRMARTRQSLTALPSRLRCVRVRCLAMPDDDDDLYERLGAEIRRARGTMRQQDLADAAGIPDPERPDQTRVSAYELGRGRIPLDAVCRIEEALEMDRGELLVKAGVVSPSSVPVLTGTESAIGADAALDDSAKEMLLGVYRYVAGRGRTLAASLERGQRAKARIKDR